MTHFRECPALWFLVGMIGLILIGDAMFKLGMLPGGTVSKGMGLLYDRTNWARLAYWAAVIALDQHFTWMR